MLVRIVGAAPIQATVYELEKLRCNLCGEVFTAQAPEGVGSEKYDATSASMVAFVEVRQWSAVSPIGTIATEYGHSSTGLHSVGHRAQYR